MKKNKFSDLRKEAAKRHSVTKRCKLKLDGIRSGIIREIVSPRNPPYIKSKARVQELSLEKDLKDRLRTNMCPGLAYINFKNWTNRVKNSEASYLDTLYAKRLARFYDKSLDSARESKAKLQLLTNSMEKLLKIDRSDNISLKLPFGDEPEVRTNRVSGNFKCNIKLNEKLFFKIRQNNPEMKVNEISLKLDSSKARVHKVN